MTDKRTAHQRRQRQLQKEQEAKRETQGHTIDMLIEDLENADHSREE